jgi:hypothetical protein
MKSKSSISSISFRGKNSPFSNIVIEQEMRDIAFLYEIYQQREGRGKSRGQRKGGEGRGGEGKSPPDPVKPKDATNLAEEISPLFWCWL